MLNSGSATSSVTTVVDIVPPPSTNRTLIVDFVPSIKCLLLKDGSQHAENRRTKLVTPTCKNAASEFCFWNNDILRNATVFSRKL
jgi:hypothetical protein